MGLGLTVSLAVASSGCAGAAAEGTVELRDRPGVGRKSVQRVAEEAAASVAVVTTDVGRGMAFVVDDAGYLVTNRHVLEDAANVDSLIFPAYDPPLEYRGVEVVYIDPVVDLALLRVRPDDARPLRALDLATARPGRPGEFVATDDRVVLMARESQGDEEVGLLAHVGAVSDIDVQNPAVGPGPFLGLTSTVQRGQSGGPVLDRFGRVVGVVTWTWRDRPGGFAIPVSELASMLERRPDLEGSGDHERRVEDRAATFLQSLAVQDYERARKITAPSHARKVRAATLDVLMSSVSAELLEGYVEALDGLLVTAVASDEDPFERLGDLAAELGSDEALAAMELEHTLTAPQVTTFFFEFGQAYLAARLFADRDRDGALRAAIDRLYSLEAARSFALADLLDVLGRPGAEIQSVSLTPGAYAPRAVVRVGVPRPVTIGRRVGAQTSAVPTEHLVLQMALEWGDWYVADVQVTNTGSPGETAALTMSPRLNAAAQLDPRHRPRHDGVGADARVR